MCFTSNRLFHIKQDISNIHTWKSTRHDTIYPSHLPTAHKNISSPIAAVSFAPEQLLEKKVYIYIYRTLIIPVASRYFPPQLYVCIYNACGKSKESTADAAAGATQAPVYIASDITWRSSAPVRLYPIVTPAPDICGARPPSRQCCHFSIFPFSSCSLLYTIYIYIGGYGRVKNCVRQGRISGSFMPRVKKRERGVIDWSEYDFSFLSHFFPEVLISDRYCYLSAKSTLYNYQILERGRSPKKEKNTTRLPIHPTNNFTTNYISTRP